MMITHYDIGTGRRFEQDRDDAAPRNDSDPLRAAELRLMTVQEAVAIEQRIAAVAPATIMLPLDLLVDC